MASATHATKSSLLTPSAAAEAESSAIASSRDVSEEPPHPVTDATRKAVVIAIDESLIPSFYS